MVAAEVLTPQEFPGELGDHYAQACQAVGLAPAAGFYGLVPVQDRQGARWTEITTDVGHGARD